MGKFSATRLKFVPPKPIRGVLGSAVAAGLSQTVTIRYGYCPAHAPWIMPRTARLVRLLSIISVAPLLVAWAFAAEARSGLVYPLIALAAIAFVTPFFLMFRSEPIAVVEIDGNHAWLLGFGKDYLQLFPPASEAREAEAKEAAHKLAGMGYCAASRKGG